MRASKVPGKEEDVDALELVGLHLRKLGETDPARDASAQGAFDRMAKAAAKHRDALDTDAQDERRRLTFAIARATRYHAEILHSTTAATATGRDLLAEVEPSFTSGDRLSWAELLDRARFYEVDACIRMYIHGLGPETRRRIAAARRDYQELQSQCDTRNWTWPQRVWRIAARLFRKDGVKELHREAEAGLSRLATIEAGSGCPICTQPKPTEAKPTA